MFDNEGNELGEGLIRIHRIITRGIDVARDCSRTHATGEQEDTSVAAGFADYLQALTAVVHAHHTAEDEIAYPSFRDSFPDAPWDVLAQEHRAVAVILADLDTQAVRIREGAAIEAWAPAAGKLDELAVLWGPHYHREEAHFTLPALAAAMALEQRAAMVAQIAAHNQQHAKPDYLVVPFLLYNLDGEDRRAMAALFPPVVTEQLVPVAWQQKWSSMKPFLLA